MTPGLRSDPTGIIGKPFILKSRDRRFRRLFAEAARRAPLGVPKITTVREVSLSPRRTETMAGLTRYSKERVSIHSSPRQTITFYSALFSPLSDSAAVAVIAHELAHAWLNEHVFPEESKGREAEADELARAWGFGEEIEALNGEAETVN